MAHTILITDEETGLTERFTTDEPSKIAVIEQMSKLACGQPEYFTLPVRARRFRRMWGL